MKKLLVSIVMILPVLGCDDRSAPATAAMAQIIESPPPPPADSTSQPAATQPSTKGTDKDEAVLDTTIMMVKDRLFTLEVADDDAEQEQGLMFRTSMGKDNGMIFVFPDEAPRGFWMKNTLIPLDIVYVAANGRVLNILQMKPRDESVYPSAGPAMYAIEFNVGTAERINLKAGDMLDIPASLKPH